MVNKLFLAAAILISVLKPSVQQTTRRQIWLFAPDATDASFITQKFALTDAAGLNERDVVVHEVVGFQAHQSIFKKYKASAKAFTFILVGKDGGEKLRANQPISKEKLYRTIDAMPMRKHEMEHQP